VPQTNSPKCLTLEQPLTETLSDYMLATHAVAGIAAS